MIVIRIYGELDRHFPGTLTANLADNISVLSISAEFILPISVSHALCCSCAFCIPNVAKLDSPGK